mgnify:CR=1 FL=1
MQIPAPEIFKAYDIRGIVLTTLTADTVRQIGMESHLPWVMELASLPAKSTEENAGAEFLRDLVSYQDKP